MMLNLISRIVPLIGIAVIVLLWGLLAFRGGQLDDARDAIATLEAANRAQTDAIEKLKAEKQKLEAVYAEYHKKIEAVTASIDSVRRALAKRSDAQAVAWRDAPLPDGYADSLRELSHGCFGEDGGAGSSVQSDGKR